MKKKKAARGKIDKVEIIKEGWDEKEGFKMFTKRIISVSGIIGMIMLGMGCSAAASKPRLVQPVITTKSPVKPAEPILRIETGMHTAMIKRIGIDAENRYLVTASDDKTVRVWEMPTSPQSPPYKGGEEKSIPSPLAGEGQSLPPKSLLGGEWGFRLIRTLRPPISEGNEGMLNAVAISPDGKTIACGGWTGYEWEKTVVIYLFDRERGEIIKRITGLPNVINHLTYSKDGRFFAATLFGKNGIRIYRTSDYSQIAEDRDYGSDSYGADFDINGRLVTASFDGYIRLYDRNFRLITKKKSSGGNQPLSVSFSPDGSKIAVGFLLSIKVDVLDSGLSIPNSRLLTLLFSPDTTGVDNGDLSKVAWSSDGRSLYAGGMYNKKGFPILKWGNEGRGKYKEIFGGAGNMIMDILPLNPPSPPFAKGGNTLTPPLIKGDTGGFGGIVYAAQDPAFGIINEMDESLIFKSPSIADYRVNFEGFLISNDGSTVQFGYEFGGKSPASFSVKERLLNTEIASASPRNDRGEGARNNKGEVLQPPLTSASGMNITDWKRTNRPKLNGSPLKLKEYEFSRSLAISPDGNSFLLGTVWNLRLFDKYGFEKWIVPVPGAAWGVNISGNGKVAVAAFGDGTIRWYRMSDGKEILSFLPHKNKKDWVLWTPEGYFDTSENGARLIGFHLSRGKDREAEFIFLNSLYDVFYRPDIVQAKFNGEDISKLVSLTAFEALKNPPPSVSFTTIPSGKEGGQTSKVCYKAASNGGGIGEVRFFHNGKLVKSDGFYREASAAKTQEKVKLTALNSRAIYDDFRGIVIKGSSEEAGSSNLQKKGEVFEECLDIEPISGQNEISIAAFNKTNTVQSYLETGTFVSDRKPEEPHLYILSIGIDKYRDSSINLKFAGKDSVDFYERLTGQASTIYKPENIHNILLKDERSSKAGILSSIKELSERIKPWDGFVIFVASHGLLIENQYYIVTHDFDGIAGQDKLISSNEIVEMSKRIKALSQLLIFDTCHAGGIDNIISGLYDSRMVVLAKKMGLHIYASASSFQEALDGYKGNGLFTHTLVEGLNNSKGADSNNDSEISIVELGTFSKELTVRTSSEIGHKQTPLIINFGKDSPLYRLR